ADTLPAQVSGVSAAGGPGQITISWAADQGAVSYNVYRAATAGGEGTTPTWSGVAGTSYVDTTATPGTKYYYEVTAVDPKSASPTDLAGESAKSAEVSATIVVAVGKLIFGQQPTNATAGVAISPAVTVMVEDAFGNVVTSDSSTVTLTLSSGTFASG